MRVGGMTVMVQKVVAVESRQALIVAVACKLLQKVAAVESIQVLMVAVACILFQKVARQGTDSV